MRHIVTSPGAGAGLLRAVQGVLPQLRGMLGSALHTAIVPAANAAEAGLLRNERVLERR